MSYVISNTSGQTLLILQDGTKDDTTGLSLIGKNYQGYGAWQNDNFVRLLENFAGIIPPTQSVGSATLRGTLWYDTANHLIKVYDGVNYNPVSGRISANVAPIARNVGDQWWDAVNSQLKSWTGSTWQVVGPTYSSLQGISGPIYQTITGTDLVSYGVVETYINGAPASITTGNTFIPQVPITGFPSVLPVGLTFAAGSTITSANASFTHSVTVGNTLTAAILTTGILNVPSVNLISANISGNLHAGELFDNNKRAITQINYTAGPGISVSSIPTGPTSSVIINNLGVTELQAGAGITLSSSTGAVQISSAGVTSILAGGIGVHVSNTIGDIQFNIGQDVGVTTTPTFGGLILTGNLRPQLAGQINIGSPALPINILYCDAITTNTLTGTTINSTVITSSTSVDAPIFNGNVVNGNVFNGGTFTGSTVVASVEVAAPIFNGNVFNGLTFSGTAMTANYADLAEKYVADAVYLPGTVVIFGGDKEITCSTEFADVSVAGAISTDPAYLMNSGADGLPVALRGRTPVLVVGTVKKGDLLVTSQIAGCAVSVGKDPSLGIAIFAKALEDKTTSDTGVIEAVII
jgi:hypothetical protein